jgi:hypothetical protein
METGQAVAQPSPIEAVSAALEAEAPAFEKAQKEAQYPSERIPDDEPKEAKEPAKEPEQAESKAPEAEESGESEEESIELDFETPLIETKYKTDDGEKVEKLSIKQLRDGFMMQKDYQRKTAELARMRESLPQEIESKVKPVVESYEQNLRVMQAAVLAAAAPEINNVNWAQLAVEDPAAYVAKKARADQIAAVFQHVNGELGKLEQAKLQEKQQAKAKAIQSATETLQRDIPDWSPQKYQELMKFGQDVGYTPQEIAEIHDPRIFKLLDVAKRYDSIQKAKPEMTKKVSTVPKLIKAGSTDKTGKADQIQEKWKALNKSKSIEAAASVIHDMI